MNSQLAHPAASRLALRPLLTALAAAALAVAAGVGVATVVLDDPVATTQAPGLTSPAPGTDREIRALMHRR